MDNNFTVYMHIAPNGKKYIGITQQVPEKRWGKGRYYLKNNHFTNAIQKYGWENFEHNILFEHLTKKEAEQKEIELIFFYKTNHPKFGYNIANGGNSVGMHSKETKEKISKNNSKYWKGKKIPKETIEKMLQTKKERGYIKTNEEKQQKRKEYKKRYYLEHRVLKSRKKKIFTEKDRKQMSENAKKLWKNIDDEKRKKILSNLKTDGSYWLGKHRSEETKEKLRQANLGKKYSEETKRKKSETLKNLYKEGKMKGFPCKSVIQETLNGDFVRIWNSALEIKKELGYDNSTISKCCMKKRDEYKGYKWRFLNEQKRN